MIGDAAKPSKNYLELKAKLMAIELYLNTAKEQLEHARTHIE